MRLLRETPWYGWLMILLSLAAGATLTGLVLRTSYRQDQLEVSRRQAILVTCQESNRRHDATLAALAIVIARTPPGPQRERAMRSRAATVLLINALAPKQNCEQRADQLTRP